MASLSPKLSSQDRKLSPMVNLHAAVFAIFTGSKLEHERLLYSCHFAVTAVIT